MNLRNRKSQNGFTLIEIMVVLVIIGIMGALIVPKLMGRADDARVTAARSDIKSLKQALDLYRLDNGRYPTDQQGLPALTNKPTVAPIPTNYKDGGYLDKLPTDPWGNNYQYQNPGKNGEIDMYSFGKAGQTANGEDADGVIGNWQN